MKKSLFLYSLALILVSIKCTNNNSERKPEVTVVSKEDSIAKLYKNNKDSLAFRIKICTEMFPRQDSSRLEQLKAGVLSIYRWKWQPGQRKELKVCFTDGIASIQARVKAISLQWEPFIGAKFIYVPYDDKADIKISFAKKGVSWSYIGTDSHNHNPSMNFGWLETEQIDSLFNSVVLHEFGHAIGLVHEHQLPNGNPINWNVDNVYRYYMGYPNFWEVKDVEDNVFYKYSQDQLIGGAFDSTSIMMYHIPPELTTDGYSTPENVHLSKQDKKTVADVYLR